MFPAAALPIMSLGQQYNTVSPSMSGSQVFKAPSQAPTQVPTPQFMQQNFTSRPSTNTLPDADSSTHTTSSGRSSIQRSSGGRSPESRTISKRSASWPCVICNLVCSTKGGLTKHMTQEHGTKMEVRCPVCQKMFSNPCNLKCHLVTHTGEYKYKCNICGKNVATKENYVGHMNVHAGVKPFQCANCGKEFAYKNRLSAHRRLCEVTAEGNY